MKKKIQLIKTKNNMKRLTEIIMVMAAVFMLSACSTPRIAEPKKVIGINQYDNEKLGEWVKCPSCKGNGNCTECKGKGKKNNVTCVKCNGTGKCTSCEGQGGWRAEVKK